MKKNANLAEMMPKKVKNAKSNKQAKAEKAANKQKCQMRNRKYVIAVSKETCAKTTQKIQEEVFDGIFLNLNERNQDKSYGEQKRLLRRIVEKRQAQSAHKALGRSENLRAKYIFTTNVRYCMKDIHSLQHCA